MIHQQATLRTKKTPCLHLAVSSIRILSAPTHSKNRKEASTENGKTKKTYRCRKPMVSETDQIKMVAFPTSKIDLFRYIPSRPSSEKIHQATATSKQRLVPLTAAGGQISQAPRPPRSRWKWRCRRCRHRQHMQQTWDRTQSSQVFTFPKPIGSMVLLYMVTWIPSIYHNIPQMLAYIPAPWILWETLEVVELIIRKELDGPK